jgi:hypothetical protein
MATSVPNERSIESTSHINCYNADQARPLELVWSIEDDCSHIGQHFEQILKGSLDG